MGDDGPNTPAFEAAGLLQGLERGAARQARIELLEELLGQGFSIDELKRAADSGRLALLPVDRALDHEAASLTPTDIAQQSGLPLDLLRALYRALGLAEAGDTEVAFTERDLEAVKVVGQFHAGGLDEGDLIRISQVIGQSMSSLSETLREIVGEALLEAGDTEQSVGLRYAQAAEVMVPMLTPILGYVLTIHLKEQIKHDVVLQEELRSGSVQGAREITVAFADLVGFTELGELVAPAALGGAGRRLTELAVEVARPPVRLVKMIGDAAMLVAPKPEPVVDAALDLLALAEQEERMPRVRIGIASGQAIAQSGDWFGAPVNLASRVTGIARPSSALATSDVHEAAMGSFAWSRAGRRRLKGVRGEVRLYRPRRLT